jgi:hypothetical protein
MTLLEKLLTTQQKLKAPKNQRNEFGKYNYRSCEDILEAVKPILSEVSAIILLSDALEQKGDRYYVEATASFVDVETGDKISVTASAREEETKKGMDGSQITGASSSYARKYALNGLLAIDDTKDSDTTNTHGKDTPATGHVPDTPPETPAVAHQPRGITPKQREVLAKYHDSPIVAKALEYYKVESVEALTSAQATAIIKRLTEDRK